MTMVIEEVSESKAIEKAEPKTEPTDILGPDGRPTSYGWKVIGEALRLPMPSKERPGRGGMKYSFINARQVQDR